MSDRFAITRLPRTLPLGWQSRALAVRLLAVVAFLAVSFGCHVQLGYNHLLFVTRTNHGIDMDTLPPVLEASVASRFQGVVVPTFERGETPSVVANFRNESRSKTALPELGTVFAAGPAALAAVSRLVATEGGDVAGSFDDVGAYTNISDIRLEREPWSDDGIGKPGNGSLPAAWPGDAEYKRLFSPGVAPPLWFGSSEALALEFEFFGPSFVPLLQSVHLGYRRKELLIAPLMLSYEAGEERPYVVHTPSIFAMVGATLDPSGDRNRIAGRGGTVQFLATGKAATRIASRLAVRHLLFRDLEAGYQESLERIELLKNKVEQLRLEASGLLEGGRHADVP